MSETVLLNGTTHGLRRICIGTVTRNRPLMLKELLQSYAEMLVPEDVRLHFVIVENNDEPTLTDIVAAFRQRVPQWTVQYEVEPRLGIAFARNRVLECALDAGNDLLTFADDDEFVASDWLIELLTERDSADLDIVGSPVRVALPALDASYWEKLVWSGMDRRNRRGEIKALYSRSLGQVDRIRIATGSWMGNLAFFRRTGLRFDNGLALAGGEDWRLWADARKLDAKTGWTPHAVAYETVPLDRLSLEYQYRRSRDNTVVALKAKLKKRRIMTLLRLPGSFIGRTISLFFYVAAIPFTRGETLVRAILCVGSMAGLALAVFGRDSSHYNRISGS
ncbi:glycosyltransferase [Phyllobacterium sp. 628]|uniref:glycosyltransferase n=1 Tax=Phyllobacterium sp. 628 TaxID=2718938 RepID=UPI0016623A57|nr:glycosyltransferase family 2 protein [Phyllobacterium sp. 628]QND51885.1 glycosyltransferase [Phyllobacterium sp. 628]